MPRIPKFDIGQRVVPDYAEGTECGVATIVGRKNRTAYWVVWESVPERRILDGVVPGKRMHARGIWLRKAEEPKKRKFLVSPVLHYPA